MGKGELKDWTVFDIDLVFFSHARLSYYFKVSGRVPSSYKLMSPQNHCFSAGGTKTISYKQSITFKEVVVIYFKLHLKNSSYTVKKDTYVLKRKKKNNTHLR